MTFNFKKKAFYMNRVRAHRAADKIVQRTWWKDGKGCSLGCTMETDNSDGMIFERMSAEFGIPIQLAHLNEAVFEGASTEYAKTWPERFVEAVPCRADLTLVWPKFAVWLLTDPDRGVVRYAHSRIAINLVASLYVRVIRGEQVSEDEWDAVMNAAWSEWEALAAAKVGVAAVRAAEVARKAAQAAMTESLVTERAAGRAAERAASIAGVGVEREAATAAYWKLVGDKLIELMKGEAEDDNGKAVG